MIFERRDFDEDLDIRFDETASTLSGYAAVFDRQSKDVGGFVEVIRPGAFKRVLARGDNILALFNHSVDNLLGSRQSGSLRLNEDTKGLRYDITLDGTDPDHQRVISKVKRGDLRGSSFAFRTSPQTDKWSATEDGMPLREVNEVSSLRDVGPVTIPAYGDTEAGAAALALRSLADLTEQPVEELVEAARADGLAQLITSLQDSEGIVGETHSDADTRKVADSDGRQPKPSNPGPAPAWYSTVVN